METIPPFASDLDSVEYYPLPPIRVHSKTDRPTPQSGLAPNRHLHSDSKDWRVSKPPIVWSGPLSF